MVRTKSSKNKSDDMAKARFVLSPSERIVHLARILIECVIQDDETGELVLRELSLSDYEPPDEKDDQ
jgi:hypothetical protein